jgi:hypothetical protein
MVHLGHELAYEELLVLQSLKLDHFPARQHGVTSLVDQQLNFGGRIPPFSVLFATISRAGP